MQNGIKPQIQSFYLQETDSYNVRLAFSCIQLQKNAERHCLIFLPVPSSLCGSLDVIPSHLWPFLSRQTSAQLECHWKCSLDSMQIPFRKKKKKQHSPLTAWMGCDRMPTRCNWWHSWYRGPACNLTFSTAIISGAGHRDERLNGWWITFQMKKTQFPITIAVKDITWL